MAKAHLTTSGTARSLRVAYLLDPDDCPEALLYSIFSEAYGRWGGRRTLITPAKVDGNGRFSDWLLHFDADIIYSFVGLADNVVASVHEKYGPAHLVLHSPVGIRQETERNFRIELP